MACNNSNPIANMKFIKSIIKLKNLKFNIISNRIELQRSVGERRKRWKSTGVAAVNGHFISKIDDMES